MSASAFLRPDWPAPLTIHAATTLRWGGFSTGSFHSLNVAQHVGDDVEQVRQNRHYLHQLLSLPSEPVWLQQEHSAICVNAAEVSGVVVADASFSRQANVVCAVMTADCLPVLLCACDGSRVAAVHAGWRGLVNGVISNTVAALATHELLAWLGPAIGPQCFEVGDDVRNAFLHKSNDYSSAFHLGVAPGKWLADIYRLASIELAQLGVKAIYGGGFCTMTDEENFFSYRRDHKTGRMVSLIWREQ